MLNIVRIQLILHVQMRFQQHFWFCNNGSFWTATYSDGKFDAIKMSVREIGSFAWSGSVCFPVMSFEQLFKCRGIWGSDQLELPKSQFSADTLEVLWLHVYSTCSLFHSLCRRFILLFLLYCRDGLNEMPFMSALHHIMWQWLITEHSSKRSGITLFWMRWWQACPRLLCPSIVIISCGLWNVYTYTYALFLCIVLSLG